MRKLNVLLTVLALSFSTTALVGCATDGADTNDTNDDSTLAGTFEIWQASDAQWHFHLLAGNGATLLTSEAYTSRTGAIDGLLSTIANGVDPSQFQVVPGANGYLLHLVAANNEIIGYSQTYSTKSNATRAVTACVTAVATYNDKREAITAGARVDVLVGKTGQYRFDVYAQNGQIVLSSEQYTTEAAAWNGAYAVQAAAATAASFAVLQASDGRYYFNLSAQNGQIVGTSQMYTTKESARAGVAAVTALMPKIALL